ncbi:MAG: T9SS type A sorting domain-containing protein [Flavipsychrobacter sp.]|nr:T9SS type A sorting domain-containing protein [Flavipsychrobacter sp.]
MSKKLLLLMLLIVSVNLVQAQTYIRTATGATNVFPFGSSTNRVQYLYEAADFSPAVPMGTITKVYFKAQSTSTSTYSNMTLLIGTTALTPTTWPTGAVPWITGLNSAFFASSYTIPAVTGQWFSFTLTTPFFWDGTSNIIIDVYSNSAGGIYLDQGSVGGNRRLWGVSTNTNANAGGTGSAALGLDIIPGSPCTKTLALPTTNIASTSAQVNWNAVPGSFKYEYIIDTTAPGQAFKPIVSTTNTNAFVTGLIPGKTHYLRVRNYCSAISYSLWDTMQFVTLPPCSKPSGFTASNIDSNSANIQWDTANNVISWQWLVDTNRANPLLSNPNIQTTTIRFKALTGLSEGKWNYVHIRAKCVANDSSSWSLDSFYTPTPCRKPVLSLSFLNPFTASISWPAVKTAVNYEYFMGPVSAIPANGTPLINPFILTPYLVPSTNYTMSVRCNCVDNGVKQTSGWASLDFTSAPPLSVGNVSETPFSIATYPNPVKDNLIIKATGKRSGVATITIMDVKGQVVKQLKMDTEQADIDVASLASGIYLLQYVDANTNTNTKFTKQ